ncbi:MAG: hypothetical protein Q3963_05100, partial [Coriobacteriaceae bacterium]|nr:hypothetical protein [Coriobacteriaceae bacterium]
AICKAFHCERDLEGRMPGRTEDYHIYNTSRLFLEGDERTYDGLTELAGAFGKDSFHVLFGGDGRE